MSFLNPFIISRLPVLHFGEGKVKTVLEIKDSIAAKTVLLVHGERSLSRSGILAMIEEGLNATGARLLQFSVKSEPSPELVDRIVSETRSESPDLVVAIGGGSVLDTGKSVSAMLREEGSVMDFLEDVGKRTLSGHKVPFLAVPTTSGTGSEATKNAVLSSVGEAGFKKSLRHDNLIPDWAILDPLCTVSCPPAVTAASGLDAVTQLLESYVSDKANPFTDSLAESGLTSAGMFLERAFRDGSDVEARGGMAYAAYLSGITLAHAGLGVVHGIASVLGGLYPISHGVACGTLVSSASEMIIAKLKRTGGGGSHALQKYARAGYLMSGEEGAGVEAGCSLLIKTLKRWTEDFGIARLTGFGVKAGDVERIAAMSGLKNTPVKLSEGEVIDIILSRME